MSLACLRNSKETSVASEQNEHGGEWLGMKQGLVQGPREVRVRTTAFMEVELPFSEKTVDRADMGLGWQGSHKCPRGPAERAVKTATLVWSSEMRTRLEAQVGESTHRLHWKLLKPVRSQVRLRGVQGLSLGTLPHRGGSGKHIGAGAMERREDPEMHGIPETKQRKRGK